VSIIISLQDIDEAIENLRYKNETTLKAKLLKAVRQCYPDDVSPDSLLAIQTEDLVKTIWETGDDRELLKIKRKNFSSVKSSVNSDLKKLYADGKNPQGIVIGSANTFAISDEAKDKALSGIMDAFKEKGIDTTSKITDILSALGDVLTSAASNAAAIDAKEEIERLKQIMSGISDKLGLSLQDVINHAKALGEDGLPGGGTTITDKPGRGADLSGYIHDGVAQLDKGLQGLSEEVADASKSPVHTGMKESVQQALADIIRALKESGTDAPGKAGKILAAVEQILADAIEGAGEELSSEQASELKQIFSDMREGSRAGLPSAASQVKDASEPPVERGSGNEPPQAGSGDQLLSNVAAILSEGGEGAGDKISRIMAAVNDMIGESLAKSGLSGEEVAQIQEMMGNIAGNLEAFAHGELAEEDIIEEIIEDDTGGTDPAIEEVGKDTRPTDEVVLPEEALSPAADEFVEIIEEVSDEALKDAVHPDEAASGDATSVGELADFVEEVVDEGYASAGLPAEEAASSVGDDQFVEIIEEIAAEESVVPDAQADGAATETGDDAAAGGALAEGPADAEATDEIAGDVPGAADDGAPKAGEDEFVEVIEEIAGDALPASGAEDLSAAEETAGDGLAGAGEDAESLENIPDGEGDLVAKGESASDEVIAEESVEADLVEEAIDAEADALEGEIVDVVLEPTGEAGPENGEGRMAEAAEIEALEDALAEVVEVDEAALEVLHDVTGDTASEDGQTAGDAEVDVIEEIADSDIVDEIVADGGGDMPGGGVTSSDKPVDEELREKTELLSRLAEAAGVLEGLGPDLSGSVYTEDELRGKAKFLSEEFDRYLSIRDKFFNAHILIKGGDYLVGGAHLAKSELEEQIVTLPDFYIGKFPVTNALFEIFVEQTGYVTTAEKFGYGLVYYPRMQRSRDPVSGTERFTLHAQAYSKRVNGACWHRPFGPDSTLHLKRTHPVVQVSLDDARAYAAWTGKRLPTEIEWEAAARTAQGLLFPWGNQWQEDACNTEKSLHGDTTPVDQYMKFVNAYEVADLLGNILEWTMDVIGDRETSDMYIAKGASWISHHEISLADRHYLERSTSSNILGFRCIAI
jgi:formylglycine-generating enzyme required for sulfatase activity